MAERGKFITLEGGDGSGKSSALRWLGEQLAGKDVLFTREPGGTEAAEEMRETLVKNRDVELDILTQILLFEATRREHMVKKIIPAILAGTHVICDRFSASTYGYQIVGGQAPEYKELFLSIDEKVRSGYAPDLTLFLDVDPTVGIARKRESGDDLNVFDAKEQDFYSRVREGIIEYLTDKPHAVIDANQPIEAVRASIKEAISSVIPI
jgi:dTMP kinase